MMRHHGVRTVLVGLVLALCAPMVWAQDEADPAPDDATRRRELADQKRSLELLRDHGLIPRSDFESDWREVSAALEALGPDPNAVPAGASVAGVPGEWRVGFEVGIQYLPYLDPEGKAWDFVPASADDASYRDFFDQGTATGMRIGVLFGLNPGNTSEPVLKVGLFFAFDAGRFEGGAYTDSVGNLLEPDALTYTHVLFGGTAMLETPGGPGSVRAILAADLAFGSVTFGVTKADLNGSPATLYAKSASVSVQVMARVGLVIPISDEIEVNLVAIVGWQALGSLDDGADPNDGLGDPDAGDFSTSFFGAQLTVTVHLDG